MKRFWIGLGALAVFVGGVSLVAYNTGLLVSEASPPETLKTIQEAPKVTLQSFVSGGNFADLDTILKVGVPQLLINFVGMVTLIMFLVNAIKFLFSAGNEQGTADAKQGMLFAGIGFAVVILAFAIVRLINNIVFQQP